MNQDGGESTPAVIARPSRQIDVSIAEPFQKELSEEWLTLVVDRALVVALTAEESAQVGLLVADDATVRELNRAFRGLDEVTDVLSFSATHPGHWQGSSEAPTDRYAKPGDGPPPLFLLPPDEAPPLGEVIISLPQARRQAQEQNELLDRELALLIVHGVLHLAGHEHLETADTAVMKDKELTALQSIFQSGTGIG